MVHLVITIATVNTKLSFRIIQVHQFPQRAARNQVNATPTLVVPGQPPRIGNLPPNHAIFYLWQAANRLS